MPRLRRMERGHAFNLFLRGSKPTTVATQPDVAREF